MTPEQFEKAQPIISRLKEVRDALSQYDEILVKNNADNVGNLFDGVMKNITSMGHVSQYNCTLCQHSDGSGWKIDMSGAYVAQDVMEAVIKVLQDRERYYLALLDEI